MMKKLLAIMLVSLLFVPALQAQKVSTMVAKLGPKVGMNLSTLGGVSGGESSKMKAGFNGGVVLNMRWGQRHLNSAFGTGYFGLQPEVLFSTQGAKISGETLKLNYLTIPVMFKFYATESLNVELGPEFAFLMSEPGKIETDNAIYDLTDLKGGKDVLLGIGLGYDFGTGLAVNARYNIGFSELADNLSWKNNVIQISIVYLFTL